MHGTGGLTIIPPKAVPVGGRAPGQRDELLEGKVTVWLPVGVIVYVPSAFWLTLKPEGVVMVWDPAAPRV